MYNVLNLIEAMPPLKAVWHDFQQADRLYWHLRTQVYGPRNQRVKDSHQRIEMELGLNGSDDHKKVLEHELGELLLQLAAHGERSVLEYIESDPAHRKLLREWHELRDLRWQYLRQLDGPDRVQEVQHRKVLEAALRGVQANLREIEHRLGHLTVMIALALAESRSIGEDDKSGDSEVANDHDHI